MRLPLPGTNVLKRLTPRGLYGRAVLILLLPVVTVQLAVGAAFIQRYYADVTTQMTGNLARPLAAVVALVDEAPDLAAAREILAQAAPALGVEMRLPGPDVPAFREWIDFSGRSVVTTLERFLPGLGDVYLAPGQRVVRAEVATVHGRLVVQVPRRLVTARNPHQLLVIMVFASVVLTAIAFLFLRNQVRPVQELARAATAFGRGQAVPYKPSGATEMRQAGQSFLDMRARIERAQQQRTIMLSGVGHDLRTPLTRMRLALEMSQDPEAPALLADVAEMETMTQAFLDFARADAGEGAETVEIGALAREVVEGARRAGRAVEEGEIDDVSATVRPGAIRRALDNLVSNGARYGRRVMVTVRAGERSVVLQVEDDGPGIPEAEREAAMAPFVRLNHARPRDGGAGVGLGLAIARDAARAHGGTLRLGTSEALGGLRAEIVLPR
ncbi:two-component system osmolarity sensor histidine kinase EnvZ [Hasllibacter halocynthiae]|uniref:histidine kinase n=1 Tax=Hasllibacter halocynthiae TaxID=595589 RepID=A0A2T0X7Q3_9RHOB|nr:ATP-binding protein [Hasllibacter halocynthiae]PRY94968.1 two-component system osmolarity sensor histidine kinase EnvZ [Hasllibacter halocynthiae]